MNYINSILISFCASCILIGSLYILCPDGTMSKSVKYLLGTVFLVTVISAFGITVKKVDFNFAFSPQNNIDSSSLEAVNAEFTYSYILQKANIEFEEIIVFTDKSNDGSIFISKVLIRSSEPQDKIFEALAETSKNIKVEIENERTKTEISNGSEIP